MIDMTYWCESCARKNNCYTIRSRPKCFVAITNTDRKPENSSEIPNNCEYAENPSGDVWECGCFLDTYCEHQTYDRNPDGTINIVKCGYEPKDEPNSSEKPNNSKERSRR